MDYGAIDLHKRESQIRIVTEGGEVLDRRIATTRDRFTAVFEGRRPMRILLEASTESEWVAQHLETLGHEVIVADPTFAPMYSERSRRVKTDRRDVAALADACHRGCYRAAHRRSASQRTVQARLNVRRELTDSRDLPFPAGQPTGQDHQQQLEGGGVGHGPELISRPRLKRVGRRRLRNGTLRGDSGRDRQRRFFAASPAAFSCARAPARTPCIE